MVELIQLNSQRADHCPAGCVRVLSTRADECPAPHFALPTKTLVSQHVLRTGSNRLFCQALRSSLLADQPSRRVFHLFVPLFLFCFVLKVKIQLNAGGRVYTAFKLYKPQVALNVVPVPPRLQNKKNSLQLSRAGFVSIELAPALSKGFDWKAKNIYLLTSLEIGSILASSDGNVKFVREPYVGTKTSHLRVYIRPEFSACVVFAGDTGTATASTSSNARRVFSLSADKEKLTYTISVQTQSEPGSTGAQNGTSSIQLSRGEFEVLKTLLTASVPKMLMWEHGFEPIIEASSDEEPMNYGWQSGGSAPRK
jgi:hypothetical protein